MRVLLVSCTRHSEPLGIMQLSAGLKHAGHEVEACLIEKEDASAKVAAFRPDIIGYSMMSCESVRLRKVNDALREEFEFFSIAGGPHPTYDPGMLKDSGFDALCRGEGEEAMVELADALAGGEDPSEIANLHFSRDGSIQSNPARPLTPALDALPFVDRDLLGLPDGGRTVNMMASRGCPYQCTYCSIPTYTKTFADKATQMRYRSIDDLAQEIEQIEEKAGRRPELIYFQDDLLVWNRKQIGEWAPEFKRRIGIPFTCSMRPNVFRRDIVEILAESGCKAVYMGLEAGNDEVRRMILNRAISREVLIEACETLREFGICAMTQNIIGVPRSTLENDFDTVELNMLCKPHYAWCSIYTPYPATPLAQMSVDDGLVPPDFVEQTPETYHYRTMLRYPPDRRAAIDRLHKLMSIAVEFPESLDKVKKVVVHPGPVNFEHLRDLFYAFRGWKEEALSGVTPPCPASITRFLELPLEAQTELWDAEPEAPTSTPDGPGNGHWPRG